VSKIGHEPSDYLPRFCPVDGRACEIPKELVNITSHLGIVTTYFWDHENITGMYQP
jgi:hypothetical protein